MNHLFNFGFKSTGLRFGRGAYQPISRKIENGVSDYTARTRVWWDSENAAIPKNKRRVSRNIGPNIITALGNLNIRGPVSISGIGNMKIIPEKVKKDLRSTGIDLLDEKSGINQASDNLIIKQMRAWALENPPPANVMIITGDGGYFDTLRELKDKHYNILLAQPSNNPSLRLRLVSYRVWLWNTLVVGGSPLPHDDFSSSYGNNSPSNNSPTPKSPSSELILHALKILKIGKVLPTEISIKLCLKHHDLKIDIAQSLKDALNDGVITRRIYHGIDIYLGADGKLWHCEFDVPKKST